MNSQQLIKNKITMSNINSKNTFYKTSNNLASRFIQQKQNYKEVFEKFRIIYFNRAFICK